MDSSRLKRNKSYSGTFVTSGFRDIRRNRSFRVTTEKEGYLHVCERDPETKTYVFQKQHTRLTDHGLLFNSDEVNNISVIDVGTIQIVEDVDNYMAEEYYCFQVGNLEKLTYLAANEELERREWKTVIRKVARLSRNEMLAEYHPGIFCIQSHQWTCCKQKNKNTRGCRPVTQIDGAYYTCMHRPLLTRIEVSPMMPRKECSSDLLTKSDSSVQEMPAGSRSSSGYVKFEKQDLLTQYKNEYLPSSGCEPRNGHLTLQYDKLELTSKVKNDFFFQFDVLKYRSKVTFLLFIDVDKLVVGTKDKLYIVNPYNGDQYDEQIPHNLIALKSWRNRIAVETEDMVTLLDLNGSFNHVFSSKMFHLVDFTPDGSFIIGCNFKDNNNIIELWKNAPSADDILRSKYFYLPGKPIKLCVHPDPAEPLVAVLIPDQRSRVLFMNTFNYKTGKNVSRNICIVALELVQSLHTTFSPKDQKLIIGYGKGLASVDMRKSIVTYEEVDIKEEISCMEVSPNGENLILGNIHGFASILHWNKGWIKISSPEEISANAGLTTMSYSNDDSILAVGSENGDVHLLEKGLPKHPSENLKLETFTVTRNGGHQKLMDDVYIDFPEGFIDNDQITFMYGVFSAEEFGPSLFLPDTQPISAFLILHPENGNVRFKKSIRITMPIWLCNTEKGSSSRVTLFKAELSEYIRVNGQYMVNFNKQFGGVEITDEIRTTEYGEKVTVPFASCSVDHCCHFCYEVYKKADTDRNLFFLTQIKPKKLQFATQYKVHYKLTYALDTCYKALHQQYPENHFDKWKKCVVFKDSSSSVEVKLMSVDAKNDGWIVQVGGVDIIYKREVYFWDIPRTTLERMFQQQKYPPGFTLGISTSHYKCEDKEFAIAFPGMKIFGGSYESDLEWKLELKVNEMSPDAAKSRSPCAQYLTCKSSDQSCEALAVQKCSRSIAEGIESPITFLTYMFSDIVLSNKEVMDLLSKIEEPFEEFTGRKNVDFNNDIILQVHHKISENRQVFVEFCDSLQGMICFRFRKKLCDQVEEFCSRRAASKSLPCNPGTGKISDMQIEPVSAQSTMSGNAYELFKAHAVQKCSRVITKNVGSPNDFLSILFSNMILSNQEVIKLKECVKDSHSELTTEKKALINLRIMLLIHDKITQDSQVFDTFLTSLANEEDTSNDCNLQKLLREELHTLYESSFSWSYSNSEVGSNAEGGSQELSTMV